MAQNCCAYCRYPTLGSPPSSNGGCREIGVGHTPPTAEKPTTYSRYQFKKINPNINTLMVPLLVQTLLSIITINITSLAKLFAALARFAVLASIGSRTYID